MKRLLIVIVIAIGIYFVYDAVTDHIALEAQKTYCEEVPRDCM